MRKQDDLARLRRELQAGDHLLCHAHALERVIVVPPLADIVQQQREHEQFRARAGPSGSSESAAVTDPPWR
jgi:hypothetical protein